MKPIGYVLIIIGLGLLYLFIKYVVLAGMKPSNALTRYMYKKMGESKAKIIEIDKKLIKLESKKVTSNDYKGYSHNRLVNALRTKLTGSTDK